MDGCILILPAVLGIVLFVGAASWVIAGFIMDLIEKLDGKKEG